MQTDKPTLTGNPTGREHRMDTATPYVARALTLTAEEAALTAPVEINSLAYITAQHLLHHALSDSRLDDETRRLTQSAYDDLMAHDHPLLISSSTAVTIRFHLRRIEHDIYVATNAAMLTFYADHPYEHPLLSGRPATASGDADPSASE